MGTETAVTSTKEDVTEATCSNFRELISARLDDELGMLEIQALDAHLQSCASCRHYHEDAFALRRALRLRAVESAESAHSTAVPQPVTGLIGNLRGVTFLRWSLFVIGGTLIGINVQSVLGAAGGAAAHLSRHDGVFGTALGIGMLAVALKPQRAIGLVPLTAALAILMLIVAGADLASGQANLLSEAIHVVQFAGLLCLWIISGGPSRLPRHAEAVTNSLRRRSADSVRGWPTAS